MQRERKIGVLRRFVVGLAVAAIVAPAAQARSTSSAEARRGAPPARPSSRATTR